MNKEIGLYIKDLREKASRLEESSLDVTYKGYSNQAFLMETIAQDLEDIMEGK